MLVMRHADTGMAGFYWGRNDVLLSESGILRARETATRLCARGLERIYCGPQRRTLQTAKIVAETLKCKIVVDPLLSAKDYGLYSGFSKEVVRSKREHEYRSIIDRWLWRPWNGESSVDVLERVLRFLMNVPKDSTLVVTHEDIMRVLVGAVNADPKCILKCYSYCDIVDLGNSVPDGSISTLIVGLLHAAKLHD